MLQAGFPPTAMTPKKTTADPELAIWERVFVPNPDRLAPELARYLLTVGFPKADLKRIDSLSAKAKDGTLTPDERAQLDRYVHVGHLLSILKAKVRKRLKETADRS
jgi:hypothetical protein